MCDCLHRMLRREGVTIEALNPVGKIMVGESEYVAHSLKDIIESGTRVVVEELRGTSIHVRKAEVEPAKQAKETCSGQSFAPSAQTTSPICIYSTQTVR